MYIHVYRVYRITVIYAIMRVLCNDVSETEITNLHNLYLWSDSNTPM